MSNAPDLRDRTVLVTGGLGFVGSNLAHRCLELGARVIVYDTLDPACGGNAANLDGIEDRVTVVREDIRALERATAALHGVDILFNCAAYTSHAGSMKDPRAYVDVNCRGVVDLLDAARAASGARFVQVGTSSQVGRMLEQPVTEDHPEFPADVYSATKSAAEKLALAYGRSLGIPVSVVRLANVYGPRATIRSPAFGFINYFIGLALQDKDVTVYGDGSQLRTVTFVDDVVEALLLAGVAPEATGQVYFAAADGQHTVGDLALAIVRAVRRGRVRSIEWPTERAAIEIGDAVISSRRIADALGWCARIALEDGLARTRAYYEPRLARYV